MRRLALGDAYTRSQCSSMVVPTPMARPSTAAIMGFVTLGRRLMKSSEGAGMPLPSPPAVACARRRKSLMSLPAENTPPEPRKTWQAMASFFSEASSASDMALYMGPVKAFFLSARSEANDLHAILDLDLDFLSHSQSSSTISPRLDPPSRPRPRAQGRRTATRGPSLAARSWFDKLTTRFLSHPHPCFAVRMGVMRRAISAPSACSPVAGRTMTSKSLMRPSASKRIISMPLSFLSPTRALNSSTTL